MTKEAAPEFTPRMREALVELQALISKRYPDATFRVTRSPENPELALLKPVVDVDDRDEVMDVVIDRLGAWGSCKRRNSCPCWLCRPAPRRNEAIRRVMEQTESTWQRKPPMPGLTDVDFFVAFSIHIFSHVLRYFRLTLRKVNIITRLLGNTSALQRSATRLLTASRPGSFVEQKSEEQVKRVYHD